jgi:hypothetical protein
MTCLTEPSGDIYITASVKASGHVLVVIYHGMHSHRGWIMRECSDVGKEQDIIDNLICSSYGARRVAL